MREVKLTKAKLRLKKSTEIVRRWLSGHSLCEVMVLDGFGTTEVLVVS